LFFFQAEDGIRAFHVTGVQTCALPILSLDLARDSSVVERHPVYGLAAVAREERQLALCRHDEVLGPVAGSSVRHIQLQRGLVRRSEERRVGKARRGRKAM